MGMGSQGEKQMLSNWSGGSKQKLWQWHHNKKLKDKAFRLWTDKKMLNFKWLINWKKFEKKKQITVEKEVRKLEKHSAIESCSCEKHTAIVAVCLQRSSQVMKTFFLDNSPRLEGRDRKCFTVFPLNLSLFVKIMGFLFSSTHAKWRKRH